MLRCLEDTEDVKVGLSELKGQLETLEETGISIMQIAKQARKEDGQKSSRSSGKVYIASLARWNTKLNGLVQPERRCQDLMQEVELLNDRQEVLAGMVMSKRDMQKEATKKYPEKVFEEFKKLEEQKAEEALELLQKKHMLYCDQNTFSQSM